MANALAVRLLLLAASLLLIASASDAQVRTSIEAGPVIRVTLPEVDGTDIRINYPVLGDFPLMKFKDNSKLAQKMLRNTWTKAPDSCGELTTSGISTKGCEAGQNVTVIVPNASIVMDEPIYPTTTPFTGLGTLIHTRAIITQPGCGASLIKFAPPAGGVVTLEGAPFATDAILSFKEHAAVADTFVFLGGAAYANTKSVLSFGTNFPPALRTELTNIIDNVSETYKKFVPAFVAPHVFVGYFDQPKGFGASFSGDVSQDKGIMKLAFYKDSPVPLTDTFQAARFIAHEFAHVTQPNSTDPADPNWRTIFEGNAETVAMFAVLALNPAWHPIVSERLEGAINRCLHDTGQSVWRERSAPKGRIPYDCGVAFTLASLLAEKAEVQGSPLERLLQANARSTTQASTLLNNIVVTNLSGDKTVQSWLPGMLLSILKSSKDGSSSLGKEGSPIPPFHVDGSLLFGR